jgi:hypothetical protein
MAELKTYKTRVRKILEEQETARNNDGTLLAYYLQKFHPNLIHRTEEVGLVLPLCNLKKIPPIENIRRSRQLIQNGDNEFLPSDPEVRKARKIKEENWRNCEVREAKNA